MRLERYLVESDVTFEQYCMALDVSFGMDEGIFSDIKDKAVQVLSRTFGAIKDEMLSISQEIGVGIGDMLDALKSRDAFAIIKSLGFNIKILLKSASQALGLVNHGLLEVFKEIHDTKLVQKIHDGALKVDEVLNKYPILKKVSGPIIAGLLLYIWLNMSFTGKFDSDFDMGDIFDALKGRFDITDIISNPAGMMRLFLLLTGPVLSFPWLAATPLNLLTAILYSATKKSNHPVAVKLKSNLSKHMVRL